MIAHASSFPNRRDSVRLGRRTVLQFAAGWFAGEALQDIELAVGEALANCAEHAAATSLAIDVVCRFDGSMLFVEIADRGRGFAVRPPAPDVAPDDRGRGLGIALMRRVMDRVEFRDGGSRVVLMKALRA